jgi:hypothetical protein
MDDVELVECPACHGSRLNPTASAVRLKDTPVADLGHLSINVAAKHFEKITFSQDRETLIARDILPEIRQRLSFLQEVGLGYLQLDRSGNTLSGGESQRIRLAAQLGSNLRGVASIRATTPRCSKPSSPSAIRGIRSSSSNTTRTPSPPPITSSTSVPAQVAWAAKSSIKANLPNSPPHSALRALRSIPRLTVRFPPSSTTPAAARAARWRRITRFSLYPIATRIT